MARPRRSAGFVSRWRLGRAAPAASAAAQSHGNRCAVPAGCLMPPVRDERGGAVSLWVVLMVPVAAFAAVAAMAGPQRLAARAGMQDAADDLATFAVAWRDGKEDPDGALLTFPMNCDPDPGEGPGGHAQSDALADAVREARAELDQAELDGLPEDDPVYQAAQAALEQAEQAQRDGPGASEAGEWEDACELVRDALVRDLGRLGVASHSMSGAYSDSLKTTSLPVTDIEWSQDRPCVLSGQMVVSDAVHASLAGDWQDAGWAASQVWPDGFRVAAESTAALTRRSGLGQNCTGIGNESLNALDSQGRPVWLADPEHDARKLAHSVSHTPLSE